MKAWVAATASLCALLLVGCGAPSVTDLDHPVTPEPGTSPTPAGNNVSVFGGTPMNTLPRQLNLTVPQIQALEQVFADAFTALGKQSPGCIAAATLNRLDPFQSQLVASKDGNGGVLVSGPCQVDGTVITFQAMDLSRPDSKGHVTLGGTMWGVVVVGDTASATPPLTILASLNASAGSMTMGVKQVAHEVQIESGTNQMQQLETTACEYCDEWTPDPSNGNPMETIDNQNPLDDPSGSFAMPDTGSVPTAANSSEPGVAVAAGDGDTGTSASSDGTDGGGGTTGGCGTSSCA